MEIYIVVDVQAGLVNEVRAFESQEMADKAEANIKRDYLTDMGIDIEGMTDDEVREAWEDLASESEDEVSVETVEVTPAEAK